MQQTRRLFLIGLTSALATPAIASTSVRFKFYNPHVDETRHITWQDGLSQTDQTLFNAISRDWRQDTAGQMDGALLEVLFDLSKTLDISPTYTLLSGYRTRKTNNTLPGAVANSQHLVGKALDIWHKDASPITLYNALHPTHNGGLGYYTPEEGNFLHIDTAAQRRWGEPSTARTAAASPTSTAVPSLLNMDPSVFSNPFPF
jgi:uncharacterized protein YcbK (DUF882 family)